MDFRTLLDGLRLVCMLLPHDDDSYMINVANQHYDGRRLISALLNHGRCPPSIADDLWHEIVLHDRLNKLSTFLVADDVSSLGDVTCSSGQISPADGITWLDAAVEFSKSQDLVRAMWEWALKVFENLFVPIRRGGPISASLKSSRSSSSSRDSNVRVRILARDGPISPVGRAIDESAPEDFLDSFSDRVEELEAAHIMPLMLSRYSTMQKLLSMFAGTNVEAILKGNNINSSSNLFCTDHGTHLKFDEFIVGIEYLNDRYWLRKVVARKARGAYIAQCQDGEEITFGLGPQGHAIDLPDGELFNIHLAIANVLHASGAGEVINKVLQDEAEFNDGIVEDEASASRISAFALKMALLREQAVASTEPASDDDDGANSNKHHDGGKGILRVTTNSQVDA
ncbi:hypothetical protein V1517DRAFT_333252 [Lipomyces orientalis]|uniref:Uncharacterized protein n=1 Tax=Lipomyces orientalis TaxID=1233043 RepID=A0ACC3TE22_9ASCO